MDLDDLRRKLRGQPTKPEEAATEQLRFRALKSAAKEDLGPWLRWREAIADGLAGSKDKCPWCASPAFVSEKHGKACSDPGCAKRWDGPNIECERDGCDQRTAKLVPAATMYTDDGDKPMLFCDHCAKEYYEYWDERWREHNAGRL